MHHVASFADRIISHAETQPNKAAFHFLEDGRTRSQTMTFAQLDEDARRIGAHLASHGMFEKRALLLFQGGLDFIRGYTACLYAGVTAVPVHMPRTQGRQWRRLEGIIADAQPAAVLTAAQHGDMVRQWLDQLGEREPCIEIDRVDTHASDWRRPDLQPDRLAMLQYTSGSTGRPKGVMVTDRNLVQNETDIARAFDQTPESLVVGWLPMYHDMGLIGNVLQPLYLGMTAALMPPMAMLQNPFNWLKAISDYRATTSGGPNFAYDLCTRRVTQEQIAQLDLSSWRVAFNGSEPIHADTLSRFSRTFQPAGFRDSAFYPCYGLAEATLFVTGAVPGQGAARAQFTTASLEQGNPQPAEGTDPSRTLISSGRLIHGTDVLIVHPQTHQIQTEEVGEIWVSGPGVAAGYRGQSERSSAVFAARPIGVDRDYLRTGDLGFLHNDELYVTGRLKEMLIIRGRNFYPHDIEAAAQGAHESLVQGAGAVFSVEINGEERPVLVQEVARTHMRKIDPEAVTAQIRREVGDLFQLNLHEIVLIRPASLLKTTSGKIRRLETAAAYREGALKVIAANPQAQAGEVPTEPFDPAWAHLDRTILNALSAEQQPGRVIGALRAWIAQLSGLKGETITAAQSLSYHGLDSILAMELACRVESSLAVSFPLVRFLEASCLADLAPQILEAVATQSPRVSIPKQAVYHNPPLSYAQSREWLLEQLNPDSGIYNIQVVFHLKGALDVDALTWSFSQVVERHEALRTAFIVDGDTPHQIIAAPMPVHIPLTNLTHLDPDAAAAEVHRMVKADRFTTFNLETPNLFRVTLAKTTATDHVMIFCVHHIVFDGWSMNLLMRELHQLYQARTQGQDPRGLPHTPVQYPDYAVWQHQQILGESGRRDLEYWRERLGGAPEVTPLLMANPRPKRTSPAHAEYRLFVSPQLTTALRQLSRDRDTTLFTILMAGYKTMLHLYSGFTDINVGSFAADREAETEHLLGFFVNTLVYRTDLSGDPSFGQLLERVRDTAAGASAHRAYPFEKLLEELNPKRNADFSPLFQYMMVLQHFPVNNWKLGDLQLQVEPFQGFGHAHFDMTLWFWDEDERLAGVLEYNPELFQTEVIEHFANHLLSFLERAAAQPDQRLSALTVMDQNDRHKLLHTWNQRPKDFREDLCFHQLFVQQAHQTPNAVAIQSGNHDLTYAQLAERVLDLTACLVEKGVHADTMVGVLLPDPVERVTAMLAVLESGAAFLPLDMKYPQSRLRYMLEDSGAMILISHEHLAQDLVPATCRLLDMDEDLAHVAENEWTPVTVPTRSIAYAIYTSGSTGAPKAALIPHGELTAMLTWGVSVLGLGPHSRVLHTLSYSFDFGLFECFTTLLCGGTLVFQDAHAFGDPTWCAAHVTRFQVNTIHATPSFIREAVAGTARLDGVKVLHLGGEAVSGELVTLLDGKTDEDCVIFNGYGPTEATINSTLFRVDNQRDRRRGAIPIGRNSANHRVYVLDAKGRPVARGVPGELVVGGGLARGYLHRPGMTAGKFIPDAFSGIPGERLYCSGDLVHMDAHGDLVFLGRIDDQVKIRGYRVECGEIEHEILHHTNVIDAVVLAATADHHTRLVAYVELEPSAAAGGVDAALQTLRSDLERVMPVYMVPTVFVALDDLPKTPNGKTDRRNLPNLENAAASGLTTLGLVGDDSRYLAPRTPLEAELCAMWAELLGLERVGVRDNFFDLGGHSLLAVRAVSRIRAAWPLDLDLRFFMEDATISGLAAFIEAAMAAHGEPGETTDMLDCDDIEEGEI